MWNRQWRWLSSLNSRGSSSPLHVVGQVLYNQGISHSSGSSHVWRWLMKLKLLFSDVGKLHSFVFPQNHCLKTTFQTTLIVWKSLNSTTFELDDFQLILNFVWWSDKKKKQKQSKTGSGSLLRGEIHFHSTAFKKNNKSLQQGEKRLCCPGVAEKWKLAHWWHPAIKAIHYQGATVDLSRTAFMDKNISSAFRSFP